MEATVINPAVLRWFEGRGLSAETIIRSGVCSGKQVGSGDESRVEPHAEGNIIIFPFVDKDGEAEVGAKYRAAGKRFWQKVGARKTFFNALVLDDPSLSNGTAPLVICEGEIDALSVMEAGFPFVVSVPDGAPPARDKDGCLISVPDGTSDIDPQHDDKFKFISTNWERLAKIKRIVIAVDNDEPGQRLAAELVRRLGRVRCWFATFPEGCKDFNDVLKLHGPAEVNRVLNAVRPYPVSGVYKLSEFPPEPPLDPVSTGWGRLDPYLRVYHPAFMVVTGFAGSGKSTWANQLISNLAFRHGWNCGIASFEMRVRPFVTDTLAATYRNFVGRQMRDPKEIDNWIEQRFVFIAPDPDDDEIHDINWIISRAEAAVIRHGIRVLLIDPWNEIDHVKLPGETGTDYVGRAIKLLKSFGRRFDCLVVVVAHPTKGAASKTPDDVSLYDVSDCYSSDTEALTRRGWLPFPQITLADEIACFDMERETLRYDQPSRIVRCDYSGPMAHFHGRSIDLLVTPNHRMVVMPGWPDPKGTQLESGIGRPTRWLKNQWQFATPSELTRAPFLIPVAPGMGEGAEPKIIAMDDGYLPDDFVDFVGWYLAEGHLISTSIAVSQGKEPYLSDLRSLFERMNLDIHEIGSSLVGIHPKATMDTFTLYVRKRKSPQLVQWVIDNCGDKSDTRKIPDAIYDLSARLKRRLLMAFIKGDGSFDPRTKRRELIAKATTTSPFLRDGLQRLSVECGVSCTIGPKTQVKSHHKPSWQLNFVFGRKNIGLDLRTGQMSWERYEGEVWCLTVPTGAFMVRRNGRPAISGNSAHFSNKADLGVVIARIGDSPSDNQTAVLVKKIRYQPDTGCPGRVEFTFDRQAKIFSE